MAKRLSRATRVLACGIVAGSMSQGMAQTLPTVVITGNRLPCCGLTMTFDNFMIGYTAPMGTNSFDVPEGEAYFVAGWGSWMKPAVPGPAMTLSICAMSNATADTRAVTKDTDPLLRQAAANQVFFGSLPNFINRSVDGLVIAIVWTDGSQEQFRHTTMAGLQPMGIFIPGNGAAGSICTA